MSVFREFLKRAFLRKIAQSYPFPRGVNEIGLPIRDKTQRLFHPDDPAKHLKKRQRFNYGDWVEVVKSESGLKAGQSGYVKGFKVMWDGHIEYIIQVGDQEKMVNERSLAPLNKPPQSVKKPVFPIGSRVDTPYGSGYIVEFPTSDGNGFYGVDLDNNHNSNIQSIKETDLRLYGQSAVQQQNQQSVLSVGQIVKVKDSRSKYYGRTGKIEYVYGDAAKVGQYMVDFGYNTVRPGYDVSDFEASQLELENQQQAQQFKVGDHVRVKNSQPMHPFAGRTGVIHSIYQSTNNKNAWNIDLDSGGGGPVFEDLLEIIP